MYVDLEHEARQPADRACARQVAQRQRARSMIERAELAGVCRETNLAKDRDRLIAEDLERNLSASRALGARRSRSRQM